MHDTSRKHGKLFFDTYVGRRAGLSILEIGSQNLNGSLREFAPADAKYVGVDMVSGPGVDVVLEDAHKLPFPDASVDICMSSSCLEHDDFFWLSFLEMLRVLKPDGLIYLNVPSNGFYHQEPLDHWRFYPDSGIALVRWAERNGYKPALLESFIAKQGPDGWNDFVGVFAKDTANANAFPERIMGALPSFMNGRLHGSTAVINRTYLTQEQIQRPWLLKIWIQIQRRLRDARHSFHRH